MGKRTPRVAVSRARMLDEQSVVFVPICVLIAPAAVLVEQPVGETTELCSGVRICARSCRRQSDRRSPSDRISEPFHGFSLRIFRYNVGGEPALRATGRRYSALKPLLERILVDWR